MRRRSPPAQRPLSWLLHAVGGGRRSGFGRIMSVRVALQYAQAKAVWLRGSN
jgi:hypothetical protein